MENPYAGVNLVGGRLCLDFINTVSWRTGENRRDYFQDYAELTWWAEKAGVLGEIAGAALREQASVEAGEAEAVFARAMRLRELLYSLFSGAGTRAAGAEADLAVFNEEVARSFPHARIVGSAASGFEWGWEETSRFDCLIWPIVSSAAELLTSEELARVGECAGDGCGWLYLDVSKNRSRRWCDMGDCGNRAKARRHYRKSRERP
jgi:predicted RNA-binding Zn ribbon-like protein